MNAGTAPNPSTIKYTVTRDYDGSHKEGEGSWAMSEIRLYTDIKKMFKLDKFKLYIERVDDRRVLVSPTSMLTLHKLGLNEDEPLKLVVTDESFEMEDMASTSPSKRRLAISDSDESTMVVHPTVSYDGPSSAVGTPASSDSNNIAQSKNPNDSDSDDDSDDRSFVGLANQGATCYLNSLLQSLYMTPEFRRAVYNSKHEEEHGDEPTIPGELQSLFLNLQTSDQRAVATTNITKSFGWDGNEAFQQHDVQELMRVLFDALENWWQGTDQSSVIKDLYEGQMMDYVKCEECGHVSSRTDSFMDVPLVIRPFGSSDIMKSVKEAMNKFVEVERMDGDNQYHCAKCDKKVDALKGLKFTKFPYILTFQLKRFDFDYSTFRRIKLNSSFSFPTELDVSEFLEDEEKELEVVAPPKDTEDTASGKSDDDDDDDMDETESETIKKTGDVVNMEVEEEEEENIDNESTTSSEVEKNSTQLSDDASSRVSSQSPPPSYTDKEDNDPAVLAFANDDTGAVGPPPSYAQSVLSMDTLSGEDKNTNNTQEMSSGNNSPKGKRLDLDGSQMYSQEEREKAIEQGTLYELFSVLIHRGSALGGHYFAYIKSLDDGKWRAFNDSSVSAITQTQLKEAFGGQIRSSYYHTSSTSAYMLLYRRISPENKSFPSEDELPAELMEYVRQVQEEERKKKEEEELKKRQVKLQVCDQDGNSIKFVLDKDKTAGDVLEKACQELHLDKSMYRIGTAKYGDETEIDQVVDDLTNPLWKVFRYIYNLKTMVLQKKNSDGSFDKVDSSMMKVPTHVFNMKTGKFEEPYTILVSKSGTYNDLLAEVKRNMPENVALMLQQEAAEQSAQHSDGIDGEASEDDDGETSCNKNKNENNDADAEKNQQEGESNLPPDSPQPSDFDVGGDKNDTQAAIDELLAGEGLDNEDSAECESDADSKIKSEEEDVEEQEEEEEPEPEPILSIFKATTYNTRLLKPGTLRENYFSVASPIYVTTEPVPSSTIDHAKTKTVQEIERLKNAITVFVHIPAECKSPDHDLSSFSIVKRETGEGATVIKVQTNKQDLLSEFKTNVVQPLVPHLASDAFKMFRKVAYSSSSKMELKRLMHSVGSNQLDDKSDVVLELGKSLKPGEEGVNFYYLDFEMDEPAELLEEFPILVTDTASNCLETVCNEIKARKGKDAKWTFAHIPDDPKKYRLWSTYNMGRPLKVLKGKLNASTTYSVKNYLLEPIPEDSYPPPDFEHYVVFARKFDPAKLELGPLEVFYIAAGMEQSFDNFLAEVERRSGVAKENLEAIPVFNYPYKKDVSDLFGKSNYERWIKATSKSDLSLSSDSSGFIYKDSSIPEKELSKDELSKLEAAQRRPARNKYHRSEPTLVIKKKTYDRSSSEVKEEKNSEQSKAITVNKPAEDGVSDNEKPESNNNDDSDSDSDSGSADTVTNYLTV